MGMSTHIAGFVPPDATWKKMREVHDACGAAGIDVPEEVKKFFNYETPDSSGVRIDLEKIGCAKAFRADSQEGYEVDLEKLRFLHPTLKSIRFYNSW